MKNTRNKTLSIIALLSSVVGSSAFACGAIAFNPQTHAWGRATGYANLGDAMNRAISDCNSGCGVYAWTCTDEVSSIVFSSSNWSTSTGISADQAVANARASCGADCAGYVTAGSN